MHIYKHFALTTQKFYCWTLLKAYRILRSNADFATCTHLVTHSRKIREFRRWNIDCLIDSKQQPKHIQSKIKNFYLTDAALRFLPFINLSSNIIRVLHDTLTIRARACGARSRCRRFFFDRLTDLKAEKTAVFALIRLRNTAVYLFSASSLRIFGNSCTTKCTMYHLSYWRCHILTSRFLPI